MRQIAPEVLQRCDGLVVDVHCYSSFPRWHTDGVQQPALCSDGSWDRLPSSSTDSMMRVVALEGLCDKDCPFKGGTDRPRRTQMPTADRRQIRRADEGPGSNTPRRRHWFRRGLPPP